MAEPLFPLLNHTILTGSQLKDLNAVHVAVRYELGGKYNAEQFDDEILAGYLASLKEDLEELCTRLELPLTFLTPLVESKEEMNKL